MRISCLAFPVLASLGLLGCGPQYGNNYAVGIDPNFTAEETFTILGVLDEWEAKAPGLKFERGIAACDEGDAERLICVHPTAYKENALRSGNKHVVGFTNRTDWRDSSNVWLSTDWIEAQPSTSTMLHKVAAHEIGHAMGLAHSTHRPTVMCWATPCMANTVSCDDVEQWANLRGSDITSCNLDDLWMQGIPPSESTAYSATWKQLPPTSTNYTEVFPPANAGACKPCLEECAPGLACVCGSCVTDNSRGAP